jgi:conjugative transfer pilus assembly protein TraH
MKINFKKITAALMIQVLLIGQMMAFSMSAGADTDTAMDAMWNYTAPGVVNGQGSMGAYLGGMQIRAPIRNFNLVSFDPPRLNAGCSGIDAFFGSFSIISAAGFTDLIRGVIANAAGYAVKLAINAMCPSCSAILAEIQAMVNDLNSKMKNTCAIAKSVVDGVRNQDQVSAKSDGPSEAERGYAVSSGTASDYFNADEMQTTSGSNALRKDAKDKSTGYGNSMINALMSTDALSKIDTASFGGDQKAAEMAMNLFGFTVVPTQKDDGSPLTMDYKPMLSFANLRDGGAENGGSPINQCSSFGGAESCQEITASNLRGGGALRYVIKMIAGVQDDPDGIRITSIKGGSIMAGMMTQSGAGVYTDPQYRFISEVIPVNGRAALAKAIISRDEGLMITTAQSVSVLLAERFAAAQAKALIAAVKMAHTSGNATVKEKAVAPMSDSQKQAMAVLEKDVSDSDKDMMTLYQRMGNILQSVAAVTTVTGK